jgi:hypothetical protein
MRPVDRQLVTMEHVQYDRQFRRICLVDFVKAIMTTCNSHSMVESLGEFA